MSPGPVSAALSPTQAGAAAAFPPRATTEPSGVSPAAPDAVGNLALAGEAGGGAGRRALLQETCLPAVGGAPAASGYRGRLAPSPTGYLHLGHARTFWFAQQRAEAVGGTLIFRNEDLDPARCRAAFVAAMFEDLAWFGLRWQEGPDRGGPCAPYTQSERWPLYAAAWRTLFGGGFIYPCTCSRQDVLRALDAPHEGEDEPVYPGRCRPPPGVALSAWVAVHPHLGPLAPPPLAPRVSPPGASAPDQPRVNWRFRVPDDQRVEFVDGAAGAQRFVAGRDFGDFVVWRNDGLPAYQLAVVVDDAAMRVSEVVRGADLLKSTARQLLLYRALGLAPPAFYHCPLLTDTGGARLAKRHDALSLRTLRGQGATPESLRAATDWARG